MYIRAIVVLRVVTAPDVRATSQSVTLIDDDSGLEESP